VALSSTLEEARKIINALPISDRIIVEAGTPLIKRYGEYGIRQIRKWYEQRLSGQPLTSITPEDVLMKSTFPLLFRSPLTLMKTAPRSSTIKPENERL
jgi:hypothetical protein